MILFGLAAIFFIANLVCTLLALFNGEWGSAAIHAIAVALMIDTMRSSIRRLRKK